MDDRVQKLESQLDSFHPDERREALNALLQLVERQQIALPPQGRDFNMHAHSFFSFNGYGYSPSRLAWEGRKRGLYAMGIIDFDVLDGVDEFLDACSRVGLKSCAGIETRMFVPEFPDYETTSPGEPGIFYHIAFGFTTGDVPEKQILARLKQIAQARTRSLMERVNRFLEPVVLDYEHDLLPITPKGNPTERHVCRAYQTKAEEVFPNEEDRVRFWSGKLGQDPGKMKALLLSPPDFQALLRAKAMKKGGVGYVQPEGKDFPRIDEIHELVVTAGALPCYGWLDGTLNGERDHLEEIMEFMIGKGCCIANIVPDRNWNIKDPAERELKIKNLYHFVDKCRHYDLPIMVGTEMNAHGQPFVDNFQSDALKPLHPTFLDGVHFIHGHTLLQARAGMGFNSDWANTHFKGRPEKNNFYREIGRIAAPGQAAQLQRLTHASSPDDIRAMLG